METYGPYLEINLKNLEKNFNTLKSKLLPSTTIIPVIKANGYGSDGIIIAKKLSIVYWILALFVLVLSTRNDFFLFM